MHLVVQLCRDCEHDADDLELAYGSKGADAVDAGDLRKSLHDESTLVNTVHLNFEHPPGANNLGSRGDWRHPYQFEDAALLQTCDLLV